MSEHQSLSELERRLRSISLEATGKPLGGAGSHLAVSFDANQPVIHVKLGYPAARSGASLVAQIRACVAAVDGSYDPQITLESAIESHSVQKGLTPLPEVKNIVAVASGKGGVGKSTVTANLAMAAALEGASVGVLDADIYGPSQPLMLGAAGEHPESSDGKTMEPLIAHGIQVMSIGFLVDDSQPMAWRGPMVTSALTQLLMQTRWRALDYLFVDMPPGTGDIQLTLAQRVPVSAAVIVTTPQNVALADARKALEMFQKVNVPVLGIIENMSTHVCIQCGHEEEIFGSEGGSRLGGEYSVPLLGQLPLNRIVTVTADAGTPIVLAEPENPVSQKFVAASQRVLGEMAATRKDYSHLFPKITVEED